MKKLLWILSLLLLFAALLVGCDGPVDPGDTSPSTTAATTTQAIDYSEFFVYEGGTILALELAGIQQRVLEIPAEIDGVPIDTIAEDAFVGADYTEHLILPATIRHIAPSAMRCFAKLEHITVAEDNPYFKSVDGIVYTKDGKEVVKYPRLHPTTTMIVPEGVTTIREGAFADAHELLEVRLPDTVTTIGKDAFVGCDQMHTAILGSGLCEIGDNAFDVCLSLGRHLWQSPQDHWR